VTTEAERDQKKAAALAHTFWQLAMQEDDLSISLIASANAVAQTITCTKNAEPQMLLDQFVKFLDRVMPTWQKLTSDDTATAGLESFDR
jgi:hypothetical protein